MESVMADKMSDMSKGNRPQKAHGRRLFVPSKLLSRSFQVAARPLLESSGVFHAPGHVWVPETFPLDRRILTRERQHIRESMCWLMHTIMSRWAQRLDPDPTALKMAYLREVIGQKNADRIVKIMIEHGDILRIGNYVPGSHCYHYLPGEPHQKSKLVKVKVGSRQFLRRLVNSYERILAINRAEWLPVHHIWQNWQHLLSIDIAQAEEIMAPWEGTEQFPRAWLLSQHINEGRYRYAVDRFGRVHNNITSLPKEIRPALILDGEPMRSIDIVNCQPRLLVMAMQRKRPAAAPRRSTNRWNTHNPPSGTQDTHTHVPLYDGNFLGVYCPLYDQLTRDGEFYTFMLEKSNEEIRQYNCRTGRNKRPLVREQVKVAVLRDVFHRKERNYWSPVEQAFRTYFPELWAWIQHFKQKDYCALAKELMQIESNLVILSLGARLASLNLPAVSLHDGIFCREPDLPTLKATFEEHLEAVEFPLKLKAS